MVFPPIHAEAPLVFGKTFPKTNGASVRLYRRGIREPVPRIMPPRACGLLKDGLSSR